MKEKTWKIETKGRIPYDEGYETFPLNLLIQDCHNKSKKLENYNKIIDKFAMKKFIATNFGDWCSPTLFADKNPKKVFESTQHNDYWIKCRLYSGANARVKNNTLTIGRDGSQGIEKYIEFSNYIRNKSLNLKSYQTYNYRQMPEMFFSEPHIEGNIDYKHFLYKGKHIFTQVISDIFLKQEKENLVDIDGNDLGYILVNGQKGNFVKPQNWSQQIERALALGKLFDFVRIDMIGQNETFICEMDTLPKKGLYGSKQGTDKIYALIQEKMQDFG